MTSHIKVPQGGSKIVPGQATPDNPIIPFIEGDGIGIDITPVMIKVIDAAVDKAYGGKKKIHWMEVYAGEKSTRLYGSDEWLPKETFDALKEYSVFHQGADDHPGWRRYPLAERGAASGTGSLPVRSSGAVLQGCSVAAEESGTDQHGYLPREH